MLTPHCTPTSLRALLRKCLRTVNLAAYIRGFLRRVWQEGGRRLGSLALGAFMCVSICVCMWFLLPFPTHPNTHSHALTPNNKTTQNKSGPDRPPGRVLEAFAEAAQSWMDGPWAGSVARSVHKA